MKDKNDNKTIDVFKKPAKTAAQRQAEYRARQKHYGSRLDMRIDGSTHLQLENIALYGNRTMKEIITELIDAEYRRLLNADDQKFDKFLEEKINKNIV